MIHQCALTIHSVFFGKRSSHANNKNPRTFNLNIVNIKIESTFLKRFFFLKISNKTWRTIKKNGSLDNFLLKTKRKNLSLLGKKLKKQAHDKKKVLNKNEASD